MAGSAKCAVGVGQRRKYDAVAKNASANNRL